MEHRDWEEQEITAHRQTPEDVLFGRRETKLTEQKAWENFAASGKIQDYLSYKGIGGDTWPPVDRTF